MNEAVDLIFLCAGRGLRVGLDQPKQFAPLGGKPLMVHALEVFERIPEIRRKIIVHHEADTGQIRDILAQHAISQCVLITGGKTRQESVRRGLTLAVTPRVLTHNAAVPFITEQMIAHVLALDADCVTTATELKDNLLKVVAGALYPVNRGLLRIINTPQAFRAAVLREAHDTAVAEEREFVSDAELMLHYNHSVQLVPGPPWAFKVTDRVDLALAATILAHPELFPDCRPHAAPQSHSAAPLPSRR